MNQKQRMKEKEFLNIIKSTNRNRLIITTVVLVTFLLIMFGIGAALLGGDTSNTINQEWKEILLLVLGAFIASYGKIIDFWFAKNNEVDKDLIDAAEGDDEDRCGDC